MSKLTDRAIQESFIKQLDRKPIDRITIKDITDDCGISRNTFYYHYSDLPDLVEKMLMNDMEELMLKYPTIDSLEEGLNVAAQFVLSNHRAVSHIYNSSQRCIYERCLMKVCRKCIASYFEIAVPKKYIDGADREILIDYYKCLCFGIIIDWCDNGMKSDYTDSFHKILNIRSRMLGADSINSLI